MIPVSCPICERRFEVATLGDLPSFPFCSDRCRLIDLGRWIDGAYSIAGDPPPEADEQAETDLPRAG